MNILHLSAIHFGRDRSGYSEPFTRKGEILDKLIDTLASLDNDLKPGGLYGKKNGGVTDCGCTAVMLRVSILLGCYALRSLFASYYVGKVEETQVF